MELMHIPPSVCPSFSSVLQFIMWMLRERRGMVETMLKINQFFPNKLPQYQGQCVSVQYIIINILPVFTTFKMLVFCLKSLT